MIRCYTPGVPTTHPRYTVTDTGELRAMLDVAAKRWPEVKDRRKLLLKLTATGAERLSEEPEPEAVHDAQQRQIKALQDSLKYIDVDVLVSREAWR